MKKGFVILLITGAFFAGIISPLGNQIAYATESTTETVSEEAETEIIGEASTEEIENNEDIRQYTYDFIVTEDMDKAEVDAYRESLIAEWKVDSTEITQMEYATASEYASTTDGYLYEGVDGAITWKVDSAGVLYLTGNGDYEGVYLEDERKTVPQWSSDDVCLKIKKAVVNVTGITSLRYFFYNCQYMESVDLSGLDTSNVTSMATMFGQCCSLKSVDFSNLDTSKVKYMTNLFYGCTELESINLSNVDTGNVVSMGSMFMFCKALETVDVSSFDTSKVTTMAGMFNTCINLTQIDISNFNTGNLTDMTCMFNFCKKLQEVDFSNHDLSKVESTLSMFQCCYALKKADFTGTKLRNLIEVHVMFNQCEALESLDVSGFNISKVKNICYMFAHCKALTELDVSNFDTSNVTDMEALFVECGMKEIDISMFDMSKCKKTTAMFYNCANLEKVNLPDTMTQIGVDAFNKSVNLKYLYTPQSLTAIGENAFYGCENTVLKCYPNTYAHTWAVENGQKYELIDHTHKYEETALVYADCTGTGLFRGNCAHEGCEAYYTKWHQGLHNIIIDKAVQATCINTGLTEGSHCSICKETLVAQQEVAKTGHTIVTDKAVAATCQNTGLTEGSHCSVCEKVIVEQKKLNKVGHDYQKTITKAKVNKKGSIKTLCTMCGKQSGKTTTINAIKSVKLSKTSYTYNGKERKPSVTITDTKGKKLKKNTDYKVTYAKDCKNPGKYTVTIKFKGNYTGTKKLTYTIKPKAVSISKLSAKSKGFKVTWKKGTKISGYQIQYSTSSKFTDKKTVTKTISGSKTTSKTITKLKAKKKYYVRVRTYKTVKVDGKSKKIYSSWSDVKKVTTKK